MQRDRFLVKAFGDNIEGTRVGLTKLVELANVHKSSVIVVPALNRIKGSMLTAVLGERLSGLLIRDRKITLDNGNSIELCSEATLKNFRRADAYLALWGSADTVKDIEALPLWTTHILVTWGPADAAKWVQDHNVTVIYDDGRS